MRSTAGDGKWLWIGGAVVAGILILAIPYLWSGGAGGANADRVSVTQGPGTGPAAVDLSSMTPRDAADRLFNRVMSALSSGDDAEVTSFLPMAIDAYRLVPALDADGWFHLSLLHQVGGDSEAALGAAREVLNFRPTHVLGLYAAGEAARALGDSAAARDYFETLLEVYDEEVTAGLPEYQEHAGFLPSTREIAAGFVR